MPVIGACAAAAATAASTSYALRCSTYTTAVTHLVNTVPPVRVVHISCNSGANVAEELLMQQASVLAVQPKSLAAGTLQEVSQTQVLLPACHSLQVACPMGVACTERVLNSPCHSRS